MEKHKFIQNVIESENPKSKKVVISAQFIAGIQIEDVMTKQEAEKIKKENPDKTLKVYSIAHEGESHPKIIGEGGKKISWPLQAIKDMAAKVKKGIKFFFGHNEDNSTENRKPAGEVVASALKTINGKQHVIVAGLFEKSAEGHDVCSIEAMVQLAESAGAYIAKGIEALTGIALAKSSEEKPGFPEAGLLLQAFADSGETTEPREATARNERRLRVTFQEVAQAVKELNVRPWQLYTKEDIEDDYKIGKHFLDIQADAKTKSMELESAKKELESIKAKLTEKESEVLRHTVKERLENTMKTVTLTDKEKAFLLARSKSLSDYTDDGIKNFVSTVREEYKEIAQAIGITETPPDAKEMPEKNIDIFSPEGNPFLIDE